MNHFYLFLLLLCSSLILQAQPSEKEGERKKRQYVPRYPLELGFHISSSQFLGDLGGTSSVGQAFTYDTDFESTRPSIGLSTRYTMGGKFSFRLDFSYLCLSGDDQFSGENFKATKKESSAGWFRFYRNLHFRNHIFEIASLFQYTPYNIKLSGNLYTQEKENRLAPYALIGTGVLFHNPQAYYEGQWVDLRPLHTEGQDWVEGRSSYKVAQFFIPLGIGIQWEHNHNFVLGIEIRHQITFTDYLDDVSTNYISPQLFESNLSPEKAALAQALASRSIEQDPDGLYSYISAPEEQRGNPNNNDSYYLISVRLAFYLKKSRRLALIKDY
ncbi:MAG: DUF6089 family protein [Aureispira sp.]